MIRAGFSAVHYFCLILLLGGSRCPSYAGAVRSPLNPSISTQEYQQLSSFVLNLMHELEIDPAKQDSLIITLGRSGTPLLAFLQNWPACPAAAIPFSNLSGLADLAFSASDDSQSNQDSLWNKISRHLERYLPSAAEFSGRRVFIVDSADVGSSISVGKKLIERYLGEKNILVRSLKSVALPVSSRRQRVYREVDHVFDMSLYPLVRYKIDLGDDTDRGDLGYRAYSLVPKFDVLTEEFTKGTRREVSETGKTFSLLVNEIYRHQLFDQNLRGLLILKPDGAPYSDSFAPPRMTQLENPEINWDCEGRLSIEESITAY